MQRQEKAGIVYLFLGLITLIFLLAVLYLTFGPNRAEHTGYTVQTERTAEEPVVPERKLVDLNTADAEELETLSGIGPALASEIIAYRQTNGPFTSVDELLNVKGIGEAKLEGLRSEVCIGESET